MTILNSIKEHQDLIILAEIGVLIHDVGKLSAEFVAVKASTSPEGSRWWVNDVHAEVVKLHSRCTAPESFSGYFNETNNTVDLELVRLRGIKVISDLIGAELASAGGDLSKLLTTCVESIFEKVNKLEEITSQLGQLRPRLESAIGDRGYPKKQKEQALGELNRIWNDLDAVCQGYIEHVKALQAHESRLEREKMIEDSFLPQALKDMLMMEINLEIGSIKEKTYLKDFIEMHHREHWQIPYLLDLLRAAGPDMEDEEVQTSKGEPEGCDGFDSALDKQIANRNKEKDNPQKLEQTVIATAFGHEAQAQRLPVGPDEDGLKPLRDHFASVLAGELEKVRVGTAKPSDIRESVIKEAETAFRQALGETRRPANDVTLWDHSYSVAALYKTALIKTLLEGKPARPKDIHWRFLRISVDGLQFFGHSHHVTDMLGRQQALTKALDKVRHMLEAECPVGNEIYRDNSGSVFIMPGLADEGFHHELDSEVKRIVLDVFRQTGLGKELVPGIVWNKEGLLREKMIPSFGCLVNQEPHSPTPETRFMQECWGNGKAIEKEVCTVCRVRPVGYVEPGMPESVTSIAANRNICGVCLKRRGRRACSWALNKTGANEMAGSFERTIWIDEVADNEGRLALVVGRFVLNDWLNGKLVRSMLVDANEPKNPSPARIRRIWETTRRFWLDVQNQLIPEEVGIRQRWAIRPANARCLIDSRPGEGLGKWHAYETELAGRRLGLCWDPQEGESQEYPLFWTTGNLDYLAGLTGMTMVELKEQIQRRRLPLYEPGGYSGQDRRLDVDAEDCRVQRQMAFHPYIPLLAEPAIFMALVPANKGMSIVGGIKDKYKMEMSRVYDRLPLHLGLVFARRRTPLAVIMEAGRAMLNMKSSWEEWHVSATGRKATFTRYDQAMQWDYPACMGDGDTVDLWYPRLPLVDPGQQSLKDSDFCLVDNLASGCFIQPSRFDFEFLDTTARRFEIAYDKHHGWRKKSGKRNRPYLLDGLERMEKLWRELCERTEKTQRHQVISTIEATREAWFADDGDRQSLTDPVFRQFVRDTLAGATLVNNSCWKDIPQKLREELVSAGIRGELADWAELYEQITKM